jgi:hypothetical protein
LRPPSGIKYPEVTFMTAVFKRIIPTVALAAALATATVFAGFGAAPKVGD